MKISTTIEIRDEEGCPLREGVVVQVYTHTKEGSEARKLAELTTNASGNCDADLFLRENEKAFVVLPHISGDEAGNPLWSSRDFTSYQQEITPPNFYGFRRTLSEEEIKNKWLDTRVIHTSPSTLRFLVPDDVVSKIETQLKESPKPGM